MFPCAAAQPTTSALASSGEFARVVSSPLLFLFVLGGVLGAGDYALAEKIAGSVGGTRGRRWCWRYSSR